MDVVTYAALKSEIDALGGHIEEDVAEATEAWLEENVDPETGYVLDRTLAMQNAAAPADMVGDLKSEINEFNTYRTIYTAPWTQGRLNETTGQNTDSTTRCRSNSFIFGDMANSIHCEIASGYKFAYFEYDSSGNYTSRFEWLTQSSDVSIEKNYKYRFLVATSNNGTITPSDVPDSVLAISYYVNSVSSDIEKLQDITNLDKFYSIPYSISGSGYIWWSDGTIKSSTSSNHTDYVDVSKFGRLYYSRQWQTSASPGGSLCFYDADKTYITGRVNANSASSSAYFTEIIDVPKNAKYARFSLFSSTSVGTFSIYGVPRILIELEEARNGLTTKRNNKSHVSDLIEIARSYLSKNLVYGYDTILSVDTETNEMDCSTFVGLCLRGYSYDETSYATSNWVSPDAWVANSDYEWSINPFDYTEPYNADFPNAPATTKGKVRTAAQLAQWMVERGWSVPLDEHLANIEPGDILFYSRQGSNKKYVEESRYRRINHCSICISKEIAPDSESWDKTKYPYKHTLIDSRTRTGSIGIEVVEDGQDDPTNVQENNVNTLILVCRPDFGAIKDDPFIVTLTPTAQDFSGTHDRTKAEISAAVTSGKRIVFSMDASELGIPDLRFDANVAYNTLSVENEYVAQGIFILSTDNLIVHVSTSGSSDGYYHTIIYPITPMS